MREYHACSICGRKYAEEELTLFAGDFFCENCLDEETVVCADCGERIWADQNSGNSGHPLCQRCFDRHYTNCERCGAVISNDEAYYLEDGDDYPYCESCYHILQNQVIHNYDYHPEPHFYGTGKRFFGVELEIDKGGEIGSNAEKILAVGNRNEEYFYCKHDGSLDDGGISSDAAAVEGGHGRSGFARLSLPSGLYLWSAYPYQPGQLRRYRSGTGCGNWTAAVLRGEALE